MIKAAQAGGKSIFDIDYTDVFPEALKKDEKMLSLAKAITNQLLQVSGETDTVLIYARIDELPEALVDILAYDLHVDWYDYSYPLDVKRNILKQSVRVHKKMGTKYAVEKALGAIWPESEIEEWFEYGAEPHHFHVVCDVSRESIAASYSEIVNAVKMYKRLSSHMDDVTYQSRIYLTIKTHTDFFKYKTPLTGRLRAGTQPQRNRKGTLAESVVIVGTETAGFMFKATPAGTIPQRNRRFGNEPIQIDAETAAEFFKYESQLTGETPQRNKKGAVTGADVAVEPSGETFCFRPVMTGTTPGKGVLNQGVAVEAKAYKHTSRACGSKKRL